MKKIILIFLLLIIIPTVKAESDLYIDANIESNGDVLIKKVFKLYGEYNGFELNYDYTYTGTDEIYTADEMEIIRVCNTKDDLFGSNFQVLDCYKKVNSARKGDSEVYTFQNNKLTIYNPSYKMNGESFYIEYKIKNIIVKYNDIADLKLSIFDYGFTEDINLFKMKINLPLEDNNYRIWGHGPLYGETTKDTDRVASITVTDLPSNSPIYVRMIFNKDIINNSNKIVNKDMFDSIIAEETIAADEANEERKNAQDILDEEMKEQERIAKRNENIAKTVMIPWLLGLIGLLGFNYYKNDKELDPDFKQQYFRDFPDDLSPEAVQLLVNRKVDSLGLSSSLLNIIRKKALTTQEIMTTEGLIIKKDVKDYKLIVNDANLKEPLSDDELFIRTWFLSTYGDGNSFDVSSLTKKLKKESEAQAFMSKFNEWKTQVKAKFDSKDYYENITSKKVLLVLYALIPLLLIFILGPAFLSLAIVSIPVIAYAVSFSKRTKTGNEKYHMWMALKNFMNDFGRFQEKELPEIILWEKYLVYANVFGIADKLRKQMEIKIKDVNTSYYNTNRNMLDYILLNNMINNSIGSTVAKAYSTAQSTIARTASSRSSSGGGFGGGFSGGGSFGGGGGMSGGRF